MTQTSRLGEAIRLYALVHVAMGTTVMWAALRGGVPMPEAAHGGAVHAIPAEAWAAAVIGQGLVLMWGSCTGRYRVISAAAAFGALINGFLAIFAGDAVSGFLVSRGAAVFAVLHGAIAICAARDALLVSLASYGERLRDD